MGYKDKIMGKNLNRQICFLSSFAMVLVVIGHSDVTDDFKELFIYKWVYGFHMPLFFFVSGFLFSLTTSAEKLKSLRLGEFCVKKFNRLLVPFFFFNTLFFLIKATLVSPDQMQHPVEMNFDSFFHYTFIAPVGYLWFLPTLFVMFLVFAPFVKYASRIENSIIFMIILAVCGGILSRFLPAIFEVDRAFGYLPYFIGGYLYCRNKEVVDSSVVRYLDVLLPLTLILSVILLNFQSYISGICGILFSVSLSLSISSHIGDYVVVFSRLTYTIFLLSYVPQMFIRGPIAHWTSINQFILSWISFIVGLFIPAVIGIFVLSQDNSKFWKNVKLIIGV